MEYEKIAFDILHKLCLNTTQENLKNLKTNENLKKDLHIDTIKALERLCNASPKETEFQQLICSIVDSITGNRSLPKFKNQWCDLSFLICSSFNLENFTQYINSEDYCNKPELCTDIGKKLSKSLIKIASTRIFSNPEQSILELPVNSLDAYGKGNNVGKFGMGFFSILYWLVGHPYRSLKIDSCYVNKFGELENYTCRLKYQDDRLMFKLENESSKKNHGVIVSLDCSRDKFSKHNLEQFSKQLSKLQYTDSASIYVKTETDSIYKLFNKCQECEDKVFVLLESNGITVFDDATGIPLEVLLLKLFTPSISTKTINLSDNINSLYQNQSKIFESDENHFIILVNKVAIVDIPFNNNDTDKFTIIIDLPSNTRVPVSRDDIIVNQSTFENLQNSLTIVANSSVRQFSSLYAINTAIKAYVTYSVNSNNKDVFNSIWLRLKNEFNTKGIFINFDYKYLFSQIPLQLPYIIIDKTNVKLLEKYLLGKVDLYSNNVFISKNVILLEEVKEFSSSGGTNSFIFVQRSFTENGTEWPIQLSLTNLTDTLIPKNDVKSSISPFDSIITNDHKRRSFKMSLNFFIPEKKDRYRTKYEKMLKLFGLKFLALETRFNIQELDYVLDYTSTASSIYSSLGFDNTELFLNLYMERFGLLRPTLSYSQGKPVFYNFYSTIIFDNYYSPIDKFKFLIISDKLRDFTIEWMTYFSKLLIHENTFLQSYSYLPLYLVNMYLINSRTNALKTHQDIFNYKKIFLNSREIIEEDSENKISKITSSKISFILSLAIDECENCYELNLIYQIIQLLFIRDITATGDDEKTNHIDIIFNLSNQDIKSLSKFIIKIAKLNFSDIKSLYGESPKIKRIQTSGERNVHDYQRVFLINISILNTLLTSFKMKINELNHDEDLPKANFSLFNPFHQYKFTETQLINTALTNNFGSLKELFNLSSLNTTKNRLQITEIAINEGSTKSIPNSVVTETIQNSLDAIRTHNPVNKNIELELGVDGTNVLFSITDYVGINDNGIVATMIPFLSSKTPSEIVTGEMGSGFFNIYRESKKVLIQTNLEGKKITILDTPVSHNDRVIEINREVSIINFRDVLNKNKTTILAWYNIVDPVKRTDFISNYINIIRFTIGLIQGANIKFNGKSIELPVQSINSSENFDFSLKTGGVAVNSYIFTKGVPFAPLLEYFEDKNVIPSYLLNTISSDCVLNIKHGIFTPVQTRGSLNISPENLDLLKKFLIESVYLNMLNYLENNEVIKYFDEIISNFNSEASLNQLLFSLNLDPLKSDSLRIFMANYSYNNQPTFGELINGCNNIMGNNKFKFVETSILTYLKARTNLDILIAVVLKWLSNKNKIDKQISPTKDKDQKKQVDKNQTYLQLIFTKFINLYWKKGKELGILGFDQKIPSCQVLPIDPNTIGFYQPMKHSLTLNLNWMENSDNFIETFNSKNLLAISKTDIFKQFLGLSLPSSTLVHELEHARRNSTHNQAGSHDSINESFPGETPRIYGFEESANKVYDIIVRNSNIYTELVN